MCENVERTKDAGLLKKAEPSEDADLLKDGGLPENAGLPENIDLLKNEGDINLSPLRRRWMKEGIDGQTRSLLEEDESLFLHQSLSTPCLDALKSCKGIYLEDVQGRKIMDFHGNNVHQVGYGNEHVIEAVISQMRELPFSPRRYTNRKAIQLAAKLTSLAPGGLDRVLFSPGATSAVGMALKLARVATGKFKTVSMWDSFHGASLDAVSVGGEAVFRKAVGPLLPGTEHVIPLNTYRCIFGECSSCGLKCLDYLEYVFEREGDVAALVMETVRNTDVQVPPEGYFRRVREICDRHGVLLVLDETAIVLGRTGKMFAFEHFGIVPDMVVMGKGLGGGLFPMAALLAREDLNVAGHTSIGHYTHEKSPLGAAAGLAAIEYIKDNGLLRHVESLGLYMRQRLLELKDKYRVIGDVRGIGLLFAVELVRDGSGKTPAGEEAERVMYGCLEKGLSFKVSQGNVITLSPPLVITKAELDRAVDILDEVIAAVN